MSPQPSPSSGSFSSSPQTPMYKRYSAELPAMPPPPCFRRPIVYKGDCDCDISLFLPDLAAAEPEPKRRRPLSYRPSTYSDLSIFRPSFEDTSDLQLPSLRSCDSDSSASDASVDQSFLSEESLMMSFGEQSGDQSVPETISLRPRLTLDDLYTELFQVSYKA
jgi:hypothetical protein